VILQRDNLFLATPSATATRRQRAAVPLERVELAIFETRSGSCSRPRVLGQLEAELDLGDPRRWQILRREGSQPDRIDADVAASPRPPGAS